VSVFRLTTAGQLAFVEEFIEGDGVLRNFDGGNQIAVSPDGLNVYAIATLSRTIACFHRDPATGKLRYLETIADGGADAGSGADGIALSPDGRFVYVATEDTKAISVFARTLDP
jgi:6-phosphogluconolactonase (cycloisomerase 2 family)